MGGSDQIRILALIAMVIGLPLVGYLYGVLTPAQRERELAQLLGGEDLETAAVVENRQPDVEAMTANADTADDEAPRAVSEARSEDIANVAPDDPLSALRQAAEAGDAQAQFDLAVAFDNGDGVPVDDVEAVRWYERAAEQGHASALNDLGYMYEVGEGVEADTDRAIGLYREAAERGLAVAQNNLGLIYENGRGVARDDRLAAEWFLRAARQDHHGAQHSLAMMYEQGRGIDQNNREALRWYEAASADGEAASHNSLAWFLATTGEPSLRDGERAIEAATLAVGLEPDNPMYVDTLAAAFAEAGQFDEAIAMQRRALGLLNELGNTSDVADYTSRLELYLDGRPVQP